MSEMSNRSALACKRVRIFLQKAGASLACAASLVAQACSGSGAPNDAAGGAIAIGVNSGAAGTLTFGGSSSGGGQVSSSAGAATGGAPNSSGGTLSNGGAQPNGGAAATAGGETSGGGATSNGGSVSAGGTAGGMPAGGSATGGSTGVGGSAGLAGPCDVFASGNTPCVAAHSTVRLLLSSYSGPLYQVRRASDNGTQDVGALGQTGVADSAAQNTFCAGTSCTISVIYDQSGKGNHLKRSQGGAQVCKHQDLEAVADGLPLTLGGHKTYAIKVVSDSSGACTPPAGGEGTGYRLDKTVGIAVGDDPETEYMVTSGDLQSYQNSGCCFDYGNVETNDADDGAATMEAVYFGGGAGWGHGGGSGPWVMADMENGIFSGSTSNFTGNTSVSYPYVTVVVIGRSGGTYALKAGNAQSGTLTTMYDGARPTGYTKMKKQGAIVLGTGGDNSDHGRGYFFEGVMTAGAATDAVMNQVQANIVAAGYGR